MSKKLLSVVLALALVCSFSLSAFAVGGLGYESDEDAAFYKQTWALDEPVDNANGTYTVNVRLTANYGVGTMQFVVLKDVSAGSLTLTNVALGSDIPAVWLAQPSFNPDTGKVMIIPNPAVDAVPALDCAAGKVVATLTYTASADVAATLSIDVNNAKTQTNPAGTLFAARMSDGNVVTGTSILGQTVNPTNKVEIGKQAAPKYTVSFNANGGSGAMTAVEMEAGSYTLPACTFTAPAGMQFAGWDVNGAVKAAGDSINVTADTTVKATWTAIMYTVSFAAGEGSGSMAAQSVAHGSTYVLPACTFTAPNGFEFKAWSVGGVEKAVGETITVTADTTVTAVWVKSVVAPTLVAIDGTLGVIDTSRTDLDAEFEGTSCDGYLYGWDSEGEHMVEELFEVVGDGTMNIVANEADSECGSGTMVQVLDLDGNVVAEYVVIIFGDVNGDSYADSNDANNIEQHENYELGENGQMVTYLQFAADVNLDGAADSNDANDIEQHENYELGDNNRLDIEVIVAYYAG